VCTGFSTLACNSGITGTTAGAASAITRYGCSPWLETGREKTYKVTPATSGTVTVSLSGLTNDLDLVVLDETSTGGCEPHLVGCRGASSTGGFTDETVTFTATAGKSYFVVVDGYGSNSGQFALDVMCP
jgi:hypothetical protein